MKTERKTAPAFRVGDRVKLVRGMRTVSGVVVEDRGLLGLGGRRLYYVEVPEDPFEPRLVPRMEDELEADLDYEERNKALTKPRIMQYLKRSGLVAILRNNTPGGRNQPRVWLCLDSLGNPIYTFAAERGVVGGATVPYFTLYENAKVFTSKKEEVIAFLASFGLNREEAEEVIQAVGTSSRSPERLLEIARRRRLS
jgi:hypothetical protein